MYSDSALTNLESFAQAAKTYITFIESLESHKPTNLYTNLESILADLHAMILPVIAVINEKEYPEFDDLDIGHDRWKEIASIISIVTADEVSALFELHLENEPESLAIYYSPAMRVDQLFDDLADIYRDLYEGLTLWNMNTTESKIESSWEWRYNYDIHWAQHLFDAMKTIHEIRYRLNKD